MKKYLLFALTIYLISAQILSMVARLDIDHQSTCVLISRDEVGPKLRLVLSYSGHEDENIESTLSSINPKTQAKKTIHKFGPNSGVETKWVTKLTKDIEYTLCFQSLDIFTKYVSFSYEKKKDKGDMVDNKDFNGLMLAMNILEETIDDILANMRLVKGNETGHKQVLRKARRLLNWGCFIKIVLLILFSCGNVFILFNLLKKSHSKVSQLI